MPDTPRSIVVLARIAMLGTLFFAVVMYVAFVFIQPELNPVYRFGSEYSVGRMGWLMKVAFFVWGGGLLALALAMAKGLDTASRSETAIILFAVGGVGIFVAGVFDSDLQVLNENPPPIWVEAPASDEQLLHDAAGMAGLLSLMAAAGFATRRLRRAGRLGSKYRTLRLLSWLTPAAFVAFAFFFVSYGLAGLGQRVFLALMFAWQIIAARGLATGVFSLRQ
jgi:Protein of unknown function (DUF998)